MAVIIVNLDGGEDLERVLACLETQTLPPSRTIVVDNASTDGSADRVQARFGDAEVVRMGCNAGFATANNVAVQAADDCALIALLNPDAFPEPRWLEALVDAARRWPDFDAFGSRLLLDGSDGVLDGTGDVYHVSGFAWRRDHLRPVEESGDHEEEVFSPCGAAALYRRPAFLEDGGFDESYFCYFEDVDLGFRMRLRGRRSLYVPSSTVRHVGSAITGRTSDFQVYHSQRNLVWTYVKDMPSVLLWLYLPQHLLLNLGVVALFCAQGRPGVILRAKSDALLGLPTVIARRRELQRARSVGARGLRRQLARGLSAYTTGWERARA